MATRRKSPHISGKHAAPRIILGEKVPGELETWRQLAKRAGTNLSEWIREAARERARREK